MKIFIHSKFAFMLPATVCLGGTAMISVCADKSPTPAAEHKTSVHLSLLEAAATGDVAAVKAFLDDGADVNAKDMYGNTPWVYAQDYRNREEGRPIIDLLRAHGAKE